VKRRSSARSWRQRGNHRVLGKCPERGNFVVVSNNSHFIQRQT